MVYKCMKSCQNVLGIRALKIKAHPLGYQKKIKIKKILMDNFDFGNEFEFLEHLSIVGGRINCQ